MGLNINFSNKLAYTLIALAILALLAVGINSYSTNPDTGIPSVMGHSRGELNLTPIYINPANDYVGIGISSPATTLDVDGDLHVSQGISSDWYISAGYLGNGGFISPNLVGCSSLYSDALGIIQCGGPVGGLGGSGTTNYLSKFIGSSSVGNSILYDTGTNVGIGTSTPGYKLDVVGQGMFTGALSIRNATGAVSYLTQNPNLEIASSNDEVIIWRGGFGFGKLTAGEILATASGSPVGVNAGRITGVNILASGNISVGGVIKSSTGGDVIIQLG